MNTALLQLRRLFGAALVATSALAVAACGSDQPEPTIQVKQMKKEQPAPEPPDPTAKMARAVTIGKSTVPVELKYEIAAKPVVNEPIEIELALVPGLGADSIGVTFAGSRGLTLSTESAPMFEAIKPKQVERVKLTALAKDASVFYVTISATVYTAGTSEVRTFAVPLIVSAPPPAPAVEAAAEPAPAAPAAPKT